MNIFNAFSAKEICGMFNLGHAFYILCFILLLGLLLFLSKNATLATVKRIQLSLAIGVWVMEIIKITVRICRDMWYDSWIPLYFCSLYLFAILISRLPWRIPRDMGLTYMTMGGIAAATFFMIYPSTALGMYPLFHTATIHSFIYHLIMIYSGILSLIKKEYTPKRKDSLLFFIFILVFSVPSVILNSRLGTNCMFLRDPFKLPILDALCRYSSVLYMAVVFLGQAVIIFWFDYLIYSLIIKMSAKISKKEQKNEIR